MVMVPVEELLLLLLLMVVMVPRVATFVLLLLWQMTERVVRMLRQVVLSVVHLLPRASVTQLQLLRV